MSLFNPKIIQSVINSAAELQTQAGQAAAADWAKRAADPGLDLQNESQLEQEFNRIIVQDVLGYVAPAPSKPGTMRVKQPVPGGTTVDLALGQFSDNDSHIVAPFELKGPKVPLDRIMPGRQKTPVQQAWDYAMDAPGARWVLVSNMKELRLYAVGHGRQEYEHFDLRRLGEQEELSRLQLLLHAGRLLTGATANLLSRSALADKDVTNQLYQDYKRLREELLAFVAAQHPGIDIENRIRLVQTLLDRLLFIAFAEDKFLLPPRSLIDAVESTNKYNPQSKWAQLKTLFQWVDQGAPPNNIPRYNGGLFARDQLIDGLDLPDHLVEQFALFGDYDFASDVSVNILGHIFEQSITDIENEKAQAGIEAPPPAPKKKREGVVYTPDFITRFIVEQTIGRRLQEIADELLPSFGKAHGDGTIHWRNSKTAEADYWSAYLDRLTALRILDPACGSGAFLIAAFNFLNAEQKRIRDRLSELKPGILAHTAANADVEIITNNLFGVDVNAESVEITKLALWLQTAKRERALESLDGNIKHGNSLVESETYHPRPFSWTDEFPEILRNGDGFDIVLGNPPYVRMELVKPIKPHLEARFKVATDRADLYAYFFELGVNLLKPGGRLGFISSSTFFRTGSGKLLRAFLVEQTEVESIVDFGDLQVFEGVTTYPAIITLQKCDEDSQGDDLSYLTVRTLPDDLGRTFEQDAKSMPRSRLSSGTWRFESDLLDDIRAKMALGRRTIADSFGPPLYGIKTGLNAAFIVTREERDAILNQATTDDRSQELLKPFLIGENLKRWHVESDDLWLIYTPKNQIDIDDYAAVRAHLLPYRERLENRATKQNWWELQQAQAAYEPSFAGPKIVYSDITNQGTFSVDRNGYYLANTAYFIPTDDDGLAAYLNSRLAWFYFAGLTNIARGGYLRLRTEFVGQLPIPNKQALSQLRLAAKAAAESSRDYAGLRSAVAHRLVDIDRRAGSLIEWPSMSFTELQAVLLKRFKATIPVGQRDEWESWFNEKYAEASRLTQAICDAETEINERVYQSFGLTQTEIDAVEDALTVTSSALNLNAYEAISAVEGLELSDDARRRLAEAQRRTQDTTNVAA
ncbi:MAG TPA: N-6 DNA methylase [Sphingomicrobium sp.]|nr:N-6 DNA methylase [Sphingomicrobium sp.]